MSHPTRYPTLKLRKNFIYATVLAVLSHTAARSDEGLAPPTGSPIVGRYAVGKSGRPMLLPIVLQDREILCVLDTGASCTGFDISLRDLLGPPRGRSILQTAAGQVRVQTYGWPDVTLGGRPLTLDTSVACVDLAPIRRTANTEILGVIGMDVLRHCRFLIDFDDGLVRFFDVPPKDEQKLGVKIPIQFRADGIPLVSVSIQGADSEDFVIDTGADSMSLQDETFDALVDQDLIQLKGSYGTSTVGGNVRSNRGLLDGLTLGPFTHKGICVSRIHENALGLRFLARFRVILDFPEQALYLRKGLNYDKPEPAATSGLMLQWENGAILVSSVRKGGPSEKAGVRAGDVLVKINLQPAATLDPFDVRQMLTSLGGSKVPMTIRRGKREIEIQLVLDAD